MGRIEKGPNEEYLQWCEWPEFCRHDRGTWYCIFEVEFQVGQR